MIKKYWFSLGLLVVFAVVLADGSGAAAVAGRWLGRHHGPDGVIMGIFFLSGLMIDVRLLRAGLVDVTGTLAALGVIFAAAPLAAAGLCLLPLATDLKIGLLLVAVMPSTLTSGVVMTGHAGGNMAHALMITVIANMLAVFTIPLVLPQLLHLTAATAGITTDKTAMIAKIALLVLLPLSVGMACKTHRRVYAISRQYQPGLQAATLACVLLIVFMAVSGARSMVLENLGRSGQVMLLTTVFHLILLGCAACLCRLLSIGPRRREAVIFMGAQKTLPLSVVLQMTFFSGYGIALVVCVVHHLVHLLMDGVLSSRLGGSR